MTTTDRPRLLRKAASLPIGDPERRAILSGLEKEAVSYHGDPNVSLESVLHEAEKFFVGDVVKRILRHSGLNTPVKGKPGGTHMRGGVAHGSLVNRTEGNEWYLGVEVKVARGKILVELSSGEFGSKKYNFPGHSTPASIGADIGWVGQAYLMGEVPR